MVIIYVAIEPLSSLSVLYQLIKYICFVVLQLWLTAQFSMFLLNKIE